MSERTELIAPALEAVLFACGSPVGVDKLCDIFTSSRDEILDAVGVLEDRYANAESGISLIRVEDAVQLCTKSEHSQYIKQALELRKLPPLSRASLEVLAIIAYNQPVTRSFIEQVRGIDSSAIVASLSDKGLIKEKGFLDAPGKPSLFGTTDQFLRCFGIASIDDLPEAGELPQTDGQETMTSLLGEDGGGESL